MRYYLLAAASAALVLAACGLRPVKPAAMKQLGEVEALYGEAIAVSRDAPELQRACRKNPNVSESRKRACSLLPGVDEVTVNITSSFWGGVLKQVLLIPSKEQVQKGDIIKFHARDNVFGFIKVAARAGDPTCRWESGLVKGATAQGVVCEGYDYRHILEILDKYQ